MEPLLGAGRPSHEQHRHEEEQRKQTYLRVRLHDTTAP
jgi:hypothetical protein